MYARPSPRSTNAVTVVQPYSKNFGTVPSLGQVFVKNFFRVMAVPVNSVDRPNKLEVCYQRLVDCHPPKWILLALVFLQIFLIFSILYSLLMMFHSCNDNVLGSFKAYCSSLANCRFTIVESIPDNLTYPKGSISFPSTYSTWKTLLREAEEQLDMGEFYFSLKNKDVTPIEMPSSWQGEDIFKEIINAGRNRNITIRIVQNAPTSAFPQNDSVAFQEEGKAMVRSLDFKRLLGAGVLHTKLWIVDSKHVYVGSANMDWQSLTQVKELGLLVHNCPCFAHDMQKIFEVYWYLGKENSKIPSKWPTALETPFNINTPMILPLENGSSEVFIASSPPPFNPTNRTSDIDAIVNAIRAAEEFVYIAVMDYFPRMLFTNKKPKFWPVIDNEIRAAALERAVSIRLMVSLWNHSRADMRRWLQSLEDISGTDYPSISVEVKLFVVPSYTDNQRQLPYARVNHNKYMVTDKTAYVGTSNWSGDYFTTTAGVSVSVTETNSSSSVSTFRNQLKALFERDWFSKYAKTIDEYYGRTEQLHPADSIIGRSSSVSQSLYVNSVFFAISTSKIFF